MSELWVTLRTEHGEVRMTLPQALEMGRVFECFVDPVWHPNECGCCIAVHERGDGTRGYIVGADGESDWVEA
jgi:hypothetical protein